MIGYYSKKAVAKIFSKALSARYGLARERAAVLEQMARDKKKEGFCLVHLGSAQEKRGDARVYDFIDIDLRGDVDVLGLFAFFVDARVAGIVGFDAYNLHVAVLCGKGALYVDPYNVQNIASAMEKMVADGSLREELIAAGHENVKRFSWDKTAKETMEVLREAAQKSSTISS